MTDLAARISRAFRRLFRGTRQDDVFSRGMGPIEKAAFERYKANVPERGNIFWRCKFDGQPVGPGWDDEITREIEAANSPPAKQ